MTFIILVCLFIGFVLGAARERILISEKLSIEFAVWLGNNCKASGSKDGWYVYNNEWLTTDECFEVFKLERIKKL